jgi:hypothetical protein
MSTKPMTHTMTSGNKMNTQTMVDTASGVIGRPVFLSRPPSNSAAAPFPLPAGAPPPGRGRLCRSISLSPAVAVSHRGRTMRSGSSAGRWQSERAEAAVVGRTRPRIQGQAPLARNDARWRRGVGRTPHLTVRCAPHARNRRAFLTCAPGAAKAGSSLGRDLLSERPSLREASGPCRRRSRRRADGPQALASPSSGASRRSPRWPNPAARC